MKQSDLNGNGTLDYSEFLAACLHKKLLESGDDARLTDLAFDVFDKDGSGLITWDEIEALLDTPSIRVIEEQTGADYMDVLRHLPDHEPIDADTFHDLLCQNAHEVRSAPAAPRCFAVLR